MKKVALVGGSFDPIHMGHVNMAKAALEHLKVDEVWFIPSQSTPLKDRDLTTSSSRLDMVRLAARMDPRFRINPVDLKRNGKSYSIDTLRILTLEHPDTRFYWLIGADQYDQFDQWKEADELVKLAEFVVVDRNNKTGHNDKFDLRHIPMEPTNVSSSEIRDGYKLNMLPPGVLDYILNNDLYLLWWIKNRVTPKRFAHSVSVARLCRKLAEAHGLDAHRAWLAGLFHDVCKDMPARELEKWIRALHPESLREHKAIWHGYVGAAVVDRIFGIHDPVICNAIFNHVKGSSYDPYAMIVFIADKLDPLRGYDSSGLINACMHDLYNGFMLVKRENKEYLESQQKSDASKAAASSPAGKIIEPEDESRSDLFSSDLRSSAVQNDSDEPLEEEEAESEEFETEEAPEKESEDSEMPEEETEAEDSEILEEETEAEDSEMSEEETDADEESINVENAGNLRKTEASK